MDDVVLMMTEGNLGAPQFLSKVKELFAPLPGTEEANGLGFGGLRLSRIMRKTGGDDVEGNAEVVAERLEIGGVCLIVDVFMRTCSASTVKCGT